MNDDYRLPKFTKEQLGNFEKIEEKTLMYPFVKDSLDYLLNVLYGFENYIVEKNICGNKEEWRLKQNKPNEKIDLICIVDRIEEYGDELSLEERLFISKVKNLITHQMRRLHIDELYPKSRLKNRINYFIEEGKADKKENRKDRIIWLAGKEKLILLVNELKKQQFIEDKETEKVLSIFCDNSGELYTTAQKEKVKWFKNNTDLVVFISGMATSGDRLISDEAIWVKVCKCFVNKNGDELDSDSLAVTYQKANPKNKELINRIIKTVIKADTEK